MPGRERCFRCETLLAGGQALLSVEPPRMAGWKRTHRRVMRFVRTIDFDIFRKSAVPKIRKPFRLLAQDPVLSVFFSLIPGLAQLMQGRLRQVQWQIVGWGLMLGLALFTYGSTLGAALIGVAVGLHAYVMIEAGIFHRYPKAWQRILAVLLAVIALRLLYWLLGYQGDLLPWRIIWYRYGH